MTMRNKLNQTLKHVRVMYGCSEKRQDYSGIGWRYIFDSWASTDVARGAMCRYTHTMDFGEIQAREEKCIPGINVSYNYRGY